MMTIIIMLGKPAIAKIPKVDNIQTKTKTAAISRSGLGKIPINQLTTIKINIAQRVIGWLLIENKTIFGIARPGIVIYPKTHRINKITISVPIIYFPSSTPIIIKKSEKVLKSLY